MSETCETYWNGERTPCVRGSGVVAPAPEFPQYWARDLVGQRIRVVRVFYGGQKSDMDDRDGSAWHKVTEGGGSPRFGHRNVLLEAYSFEPDDWDDMLDIALEEYVK